MESIFGELPVEELVVAQPQDRSSLLAGPASEEDLNARVLDSSNTGQEKTTCARSVHGGPHRAQY